ncbi:MAG: glycosyltransferase family 9 protein [Planctomycetes bacterium]|nr:glycosyltransferase family 9 protein [Planctomycetota bacterium]
MSEETPRILLVRLSAIGDCLHAVPALVALRERFPKAHIGWAIEDAAHTLLKGHPLVDRFHIYPRRAFKRKEGRFLDRVKALSNFRKELREAKYETAIDLQGLTKSGLVSWWSRAHLRIGFKGEDSRELNLVFANRRVAMPEHAVHVVERNLALLSPLGIGLPDRPGWMMPAYDEERPYVEKFLAEAKLMDGAAPKPFAIVNPGATWVTKRWPPERFGEVARQLINDLHLPVVATWAGDEEKAAAEVIVKAAGDGAVLAPPTSLRELAALTARAHLFVGNDTGPLHLAVALGVGCVAVFGATDPLRNGPYGTGNRIQAAGPECQPCWKTQCAHSEPLACLNRVQSKQVVTSCASILGRRALT